MSSLTAPKTATPSSTPNLEELAAFTLEQARAAGAHQAETDIGLSNGFSVSVRLGEVETLEYQRDRGLSVGVYFQDAQGGYRKASASTADLTHASIRETVLKACSIARFTAADACAGLADAALMARDLPDLSLFHPWDLSPEEAIELARNCEAAALGLDKRVRNSEGASISTRRAFHVYGNSHGFVGAVRGTNHSVACSVVAVQDEEMQRDYWYTAARDRQDLEAAIEVGKRSASRALARLNSRKLATRRAPVLFAPEIARGLIGHFLSAIAGRAQYQKSTFLLGAAGKRVFPPFVRIAERPRIPKAVGSAAFDAEGVATRDRELIDKGVLQGYVLGSYSARKLGLQSTGNAGGVHNVIVADTGENQAALLQRMGKGLFVTELMGQGVNGVTGDYSRGAAGFWVQDGAIQFPVHEITIAGNLKDMLLNIVAIGNDVDRRGNLHVGSILLDHMTIAGN